jgi:hypothetical protein
MKRTDGMIRFLCLYPYDEVFKIFCALDAAADKKDLESLIWCAWRLDWFHDRGGTSQGGLSNEQQDDLFEQAYNRGNMEPPPALIADMVAPDKEEPEPVTAREAGEALKSLEALRGAVAALAGEEAE